MPKYTVDLYLNIATSVHDVNALDEESARAYAKDLVQRYEKHYVERGFTLEGHHVTTSQSDDLLISDTTVNPEEDE